MAYVSAEKTKEVRNELKAAFPSKDGWTFSVRNDNYSTVVVSIMKAPINFCEGHESLNHYYLENYDYASILEAIKTIANKGNFDKSDPMTDYFHVGFYLDMNIGKWDKPFEFVDNGKGEEYIAKYEQIAAEQESIREIEAVAADYEAEVSAQEYTEEYGPKSDVDAVDLSTVQVVEVEPFEDTALFPKVNKNCWITEYKEQIIAKKYNEEVVEVRAVAPLSPQQFEAFSFRLMDYNEWLQPYGGSYSNAEFSTEDTMKFTEADWTLFRETAKTIVLKVLNVVTGEFFYTNSETYQYARYVGFAKV